jgi:hypothetical protein
MAAFCLLSQAAWRQYLRAIVVAEDTAGRHSAELPAAGGAICAAVAVADLLARTGKGYGVWRGVVGLSET